MSGGAFLYLDSRLKTEIFGFADKWSERRNLTVFGDIEISELVYDVLCLIHDYDWYVCGDTDEENYLMAKAKFKEKWLRPPQADRVKNLIDGMLNDTREKLYKTYGITENTSRVDFVDMQAAVKLVGISGANRME